MTVQHTHKIDGQLHDGCPNCDLIREKKTRTRAHIEVDKDLERITEKGALRFPSTRRRKKDQP